LNLTNFSESSGINFNRKFKDLKIYDNKDTREFLILSSTNNLISIYIYDKTNSDESVRFLISEHCKDYKFIPNLLIDYQNSDEFFGAFQQFNKENNKIETIIGLFNKANGGCTLRNIINRFPY
jgi:hypothetical protein